MKLPTRFSLLIRDEDVRYAAKCLAVVAAMLALVGFYFHFRHDQPPFIVPDPATHEELLP